APRAVPLSLVSRLEDFEVGKIEVSGLQRVIQYRGALMPLIPFSERMELKEKGSQPVLVFSDRDRSMGLMVDSIVDIVEERINVQITSENNFGMLGSAIIHGQAMDVIDVGHFLSVAHNDWFGAKADGQFQKKGRPLKILLVDDSPFFRNMLSPMLGIAGYDVVSAQSGDEAMGMCNAGEHFDLIISDIEMPGMNGYEFAEKVKSGSCKWKDVPLVALSSHATAQDLDRGKAAGFNDYIAKFDREALLRSIASLGEAA
ncbi:MAG: response regulator, partial [Alphaproteobacteria bacterium]|nr:response regulator [Alphaproteobacteria bacterium]